MFDHAIGQDASLALSEPPVELAAPPAFQVWDAANRLHHAAWLATWEAHPERDIFLHPAYAALYAAPGKARAMCAAWKAPNANILHPFLLRDLTVEAYWRAEFGPLSDCTSPYGYAGPSFWGAGDPQETARLFWTHFDAWAWRMHVVSDFVRFSLFPDNRLPYPVAVIRKQDNVVRSLDRNDAELWKDLKHNTRKKISSARRLGVHVLQDPTGERLADFARIYEHTMERRQAAPSYRFARAYFEQLRQTLQGKFRFFHAIHDGRVISTELVLVSRRIVYSFRSEER